MYQEERLIAILEYIRQHQRISVEDICELFQVSRDTARRDIVKLEEQGQILRTRGGAIWRGLNKDVSGYGDRLQEEPAVKRAIGRLAASLVQTGDYLFMDASTTVMNAAAELRTDGHVVVTNSIDIAGILSQKPGITVHLLGGVVDSRHRFIYGARTLEMLRDYQADKLIIGTSGITPDGLTNPFEEEGYVMKEMMKRSDQVIVLADHTKFGLRQFYRVAGLESIDILITDREPEYAMKEALLRHDINIMITKGENEP
ncbi:MULTISPECIES: DeoR/GlpR family DNA-binding transcription regulator [unclassified Paenibacillus]|uniref:DeoR/GlpR family DNA-binding transcription regulator n=1 Tax=unclassified Paenibacillus TaxID=185978 RepID=UPI001AE990CF|nr:MULTISPECIES: DeoR/GlpR family DNA-binding transcription regulator [unclassified Paenibacillus]MBP1154592.1 DeoR/GlpR family transcriptional regulator of sugar metabolism [Paenibacillus sp. PvP091]MBP1170024.1 DeoR/GlpR family transcriptional regulator of sugar metabolism [Paenibacillus sp. PvR098]MBP2441052.1 DeoR/GlpR family transcriptional regulator of sugar metabolism [Paenibacillus sp. PvP052]